MKRSEALKLIRERIEKMSAGDITLDQLLRVIEEIGMKPPPTVIKVAENKEYGVLEHFAIVNEWDAED